MGTAREVTRVVGDTPMRWLEHGEGAPVVLVHGIPSGARLWRHVLPRLAGVRGLAWEMVGYGESIPAGQGRDLSIAAQADYLIRWLDALGIEQAILGGHDLGGGVVQIAAVRHPGRCAGLLLTNSIGYDNWPVPEVRALRAVGGLVRRLPARAVELVVFRPLMALGHDHPGAAQESLGIHWPPYAVHGAGEALVRQIRALDVRDTLALAPLLPRLRGVPARVVWGAADRFLPLRYGERFARDLRAPLTRIARGKHFTPEDHPEAIAAALQVLVTEG